ncbi:hypothetical protein GW17_00007689 [Ensete ventricosum]|nr:hypothetical protein GW17_00007689 [Ensete ventricosum]
MAYYPPRRGEEETATKPGEKPGFDAHCFLLPSSPPHLKSFASHLPVNDRRKLRVRTPNDHPYVKSNPRPVRSRCLLPHDSNRNNIPTRCADIPRHPLQSPPYTDPLDSVQWNGGGVRDGDPTATHVVALNGKQSGKQAFSTRTKGLLPLLPESYYRHLCMRMDRETESLHVA